MRYPALPFVLLLACGSPVSVRDSSLVADGESAVTTIPEGTREALAVQRLANEARAKQIRALTLP